MIPHAIRESASFRVLYCFMLDNRLSRRALFSVLGRRLRRELVVENVEHRPRGVQELKHAYTMALLHGFDRAMTRGHVSKRVAERLLENFPQDFGVLFVHFPLVDGMRHVHGWMSWQQLSVAFRADEALGLILAELDARGLRDETLIIVTSDHGGHDTTHGYSYPEDMTIPWVVSGPGVQPKALTMPVNTMDTAATAAFMLGLPIPPEWDGVPVYEAFGLPVERQSAPCE